MEQEAKKNWWPLVFGGLVVVLLGCGLMTLIFGGAAGWLAFTNPDSKSDSTTSPTAGNASTPVATNISLATAPATAISQESSSPTVAAPPTDASPTDAPPADSPPADAPPANPPAEGLVSHVHPGGWEVDLSSQWRVDFDPDSGTMDMYNYPADVPGSGVFEPGMTRITVHPKGPTASLAELMAKHPASGDMHSTQLEENLILPGGVEAVRREGSSEMGTYVELYYVIKGLGYQAIGFGEKAPFDEAMRTLRPAPGSDSASNAPAASAGALCSSRDSTEEVELKVENQGVFGVSVQWMDFDCTPVERKTLAPDESYSTKATVGHVFAAGGHGHDHGSYVIPSGGGTWTITGPVAP